MAATATTKPTGMVNNVKVTCSGCGARELYVNPIESQRQGGWKCPHCGKTH
jgi:transposase-like protein